MRYAATEAEWRRVAGVLARAGRFGFDTETYGHVIKKTSAPHRARVHTWSVAVLTDVLHPRGYLLADGVVLPWEALLFPPLRSLLEAPDIAVVAHNLPHDEHAVHNLGIRLRGGVDTVGRARLTYPELKWAHNLKALGRAVLGRDMIEYHDVVDEEVDEVTEKVVTVVDKLCLCGEPGCRKRKLPDHAKYEESHEMVDRKVKKVIREIPLPEIVPGHYRWELYLDYGVQDAERVLELEDHMDGQEKRGWRLPDVPWAGPAWRGPAAVQDLDA